MSSLSVLVLGAGALFGVAGAASAEAAPYVSARQCVAGGGQVTHSAVSPTGSICLGGEYNGRWVIYT
ncbi:hypothetical protein [Streptomyces caatingaensis]|nr:hypothetical protein [Streptomyces caatingaensis]